MSYVSFFFSQKLVPILPCRSHWATRRGHKWRNSPEIDASIGCHWPMPVALTKLDGVLYGDLSRWADYQLGACRAKQKNRDDLFCSLSRTYSTGICNFPLQKTNQRVISCPLKALSPRPPPSVAESAENAPNRNALSPVFWSFVARCHRAAQLEWLLVDDLIE